MLKATLLLLAIICLSFVSCVVQMGRIIVDTATESHQEIKDNISDVIQVSSVLIYRHGSGELSVGRTELTLGMRGNDHARWGTTYETDQWGDQVKIKQLMITTQGVEINAISSFHRLCLMGTCEISFTPDHSIDYRKGAFFKNDDGTTSTYSFSTHSAPVVNNVSVFNEIVARYGELNVNVTQKGGSTSLGFYEGADSWFTFTSTTSVFTSDMQKHKIKTSDIAHLSNADTLIIIIDKKGLEASLSALKRLGAK
jgi:hypothetical protein